MVFPETMPTRQELIVDSEDNAWAERFLGLQHSQPMSWGVEAEPGFPETDSVWDVFNPEGIWLGAVELIPDRAVRQIGNDWVLFGGEDDDGVHHVWLYGLIKEDSGR